MTVGFQVLFTFFFLQSCRSIASKDISLKIQVAEDVNELPLPQFIPSREAAWQNFYSENCDLINSIRANLESHEEATKASRK